MAIRLPRYLPHVCAAFFIPAGAGSTQDGQGKGWAAFLTTDAKVYLRTLTAGGTWDSSTYGDNAVDVALRWVGYAEAVTAAAPAVAAVVNEGIPWFVQAGGSGRTVIIPHPKAEADATSAHAWFTMKPRTGQEISHLFPHLPGDIADITSATALRQQPDKAVVFAGAAYHLAGIGSPSTDPFPATQHLPFAVHAALTIDEDTLLLKEADDTWHVAAVRVPRDDATGIRWSQFTLTTT
ncbi:hypothetical protein [Streptomyces sp. NPDC059788]|uniref:hypothetical protein n=1 Tax=Streptomyces sp. NPDC059788 TaxID=3346948 RepID=UPI003657BE87